MIEYIYFVKCPNCEDEHFYFFNDAKECAMSQLSKKPIITQTEVNRNDFGECTDSCDLGTVWSWEDMMKDVSTDSEQTTFSKTDTVECDNCFDQEFDALDNSLDEDLEYEFKPTELQKAKAEVFKLNGIQRFKEDETLPQIYALYKELDAASATEEPINGKNAIDDFLYFYERFQHLKKNRELTVSSLDSQHFAGSIKFKNENAKKKLIDEAFLKDNEINRMSIPADKSIEDLVEEMEENEDTVECKWCDELFDKSECRYEVNLGWLCDRCQAAIKSRGETLTFREGPLDEAIKPNDQVEFDYDNLKVTLQGKKRAEDDWDEAEEVVSYTLVKNRTDVATDIWENFIQEEDARDIEGGLETLEDDRAWNDFLATRFDALLDKYYDELLDYYRKDAIKEYEETHSLNESYNPKDLIELEYPSLTVTLYGPKRDIDDWDEEEYTDSHVFLVPKVEVATAIWENWITEEDAEDVLGGLKTLEDDRLWELFLEDHFDGLFEKYKTQILGYFKEEAEEDFRERSQEEYQMNKLAADMDRMRDEWRDQQIFGESFEKQKPFLEEFDDAETHKAGLTGCPECGTISYDMKEQYCTNCGLNL